VGQEAGVAAYHVPITDDGSVLGRFNLVFVEDGAARLGYRVAEHAAGRGLATARRLICDSFAADRCATARAIVPVAVGVERDAAASTAEQRFLSLRMHRGHV
jgi:hypothetical protein